MHLDFKVDAPARKAYIKLPQTDKKRKKKSHKTDAWEGNDDKNDER